MCFVSLNYECPVSFYSSSSYCFPPILPLCKWNKSFTPLKVYKWNKPCTPLHMYIVICTSNNNNDDNNNENNNESYIVSVHVYCWCTCLW